MKEIQEFPGYFVTENGEIWSNFRKKFLKFSIDKNGYFIVRLRKNNKTYRRLVHRLVAITYIPNPNKYPIVNHIDENKQNNSIDNLEWCDTKYNNNYGTRNERLSIINGIPVQCVETGIIYHSASEAGRILKIDNSKISKICNKIPGFKTVGGYHWEYVK